jgi:uncharacterized membrane protein
VLGLIGLIATTAAVAFFVLPFWSFIRVSRLTREVDDLRARLSALERGTTSATAAGAAAARPTPAAPAAPVVPAAVVTPAAAQPDTAASAETPSVPPLVTIDPVDPIEPIEPIASTFEPDDLEARVGGRWLL